MNRWLNRPARRSVSCQLVLSGQNAEISRPANPARMLITRIVAGHVIAANQPEQLAGQPRQRKTMRLDGDEQSGPPRNLPKQFGKSRVLKVVQKQIGDDNFFRSRRHGDQSKTSATIVSARQPDLAKAASVSAETLFCRSSNVTVTSGQTWRNLLRDAQQEDFHRPHRVR